MVQTTLGWARGYKKCCEICPQALFSLNTMRPLFFAVRELVCGLYFRLKLLRGLQMHYLVEGPCFYAEGASLFQHAKMRCVGLDGKLLPHGYQRQQGQ